MKTVVITGASKGIGFELCKKFLQNGHYVVAVSRTTNSLLALKYPNLRCIQLDLNNLSTENVPEGLKDLTQVDILINNAGAIINKPFQEITQEDLTRVYQTNVFSIFSIIQVLFPKLSVAPNAHIVNISSMGGFQGASKFAGLSAYSSSKAAVSCLTECLAEEFKETNIKVNALCLGAVNTEMLQNAFPGYVANTSAEQMADYIHDFANKSHQYYNGKVLPVSNSTP